jgi:hypothetical protein
MMSRGNRREAIFYNDVDRVEFLRTLGQACLKSDRLRIGSASYVSNLLSSVDSKRPVSSDPYSAWLRTGQRPTANLTAIIRIDSP